MTTISVCLPESLENFVATQVVAQGHSSAGEYMLALLRQAQQAKERNALEVKLREGVEALDRGEGREMTSDDWERLRNGIRDRYGVNDQP